MRKKILLILHLLIILSTLWAVAYYFYGGPDILGSSGIQCFKYFTTDSNVLALIASVICLVYSGRKRPRWTVLFQYAAAVSVTITLLTVIFFLGPVAAVKGKGLATFLLFYKGNVFVLHFSTPVLAITAFLMEQGSLSKKDTIWGIIPEVIYSIVYLVMVVILKVWSDWYGFTFGGKMYLVPVVMVVMYSFTAGLSIALQAIKHKINS